MYSKAALSLAVLAVARLAAANPYCLLTAVNKFEHPADQKTLCCKEAEKVKEYISEVCPSSSKDAAEEAFEKACKDAGLSGGDDCKADSSSSSSGSASKTSSSKGGQTSAPYPVTVTSVFYDNECSCTKTHTYSTSVPSGSTGFVTASNPIATGTAAVPSGGASQTGGAGGAGGAGSGPAATGSPISPATPAGTGSSGTQSFTGAGTRNVVSAAAGLLAIAAAVAAL